MSPSFQTPSRLLTVALLTLATTLASAQSNGPRRPGGSSSREPSGFKQNPQVLSAFRDVVAKPARSVVRVRSNAKDVALGTIVAADGWILTKNSELMPGATPYVVLRDGRTLAAKVTGVDNKWDLAMLKIDATDLVPVQWRDAKSAAVGELLAAPGTDASPVAVGVLSVVARAVRPRELPSAQPPASAGFLGVGLDEGDGGARITHLVPNAAAAKAGLKVDDVVTSIADVPIIDSETMVNTIQHHKPGDVVSIRLKRGGDELEIKATLDKRPPPDPGTARRDFQNNLGSELSNRRGGFPQILQHDLVLKPSDCGGPVVDLDGKAIGLNIARAGRVESYAIPAEAVQALIPDLQSGKLSPTREAPATKPTVTTAPTTKPAK